LLMVENEGTMLALFHRIVDEGLTVREVERLARGTGGEQPSTNGQTTTERAPRTEKDPNLAALEEQMSHLFGTPVSINPADEGGRIVVPYYSDEDLQRILDLLGIEL